MAVSTRGTKTGAGTGPLVLTGLPAGLSKVDVEALHLSINQTWESGSSHNIHLLENGDIGVILSKGQPERNQIPWNAEGGTIVIALNVDEDRDEVHYSNVAFVGGAEEVMSQAIERLIACRDAVRRVRTP